MSNQISRESSYYDNTRLSSFKECPRKYFLRHVLHWTYDGERLSIPLVFGSAWHAGMDAMWGAQGYEIGIKVQLARLAFSKSWMEDGYPDPEEMTMESLDSLSPRTPGIAAEMFYEYATQRAKMLEECEVIAIEQPIAMPFPGLQDTWYIGKLDKVFRWNGLHIGEHKTTSMYATAGNFQNSWVDSWEAAPQIKGYQVVGSVYHPDLQDVWVDGALVHKKIHSAFKFIPVSHTLPILKGWLEDTTDWIHNIESHTFRYREEGNLSRGTFPRNEDSCFGKYGQCPFLPICGTCNDPSQLPGPPPGYRVEKWEPFEELGIGRLCGEGNEKSPTE